APQFAPMSTLEYGCGPGRLALPLARRPGSGVAGDRSPAMLVLAALASQRARDLFAAPARTFDLVVCYHVLQRLPRIEGVDLLRRLIATVGADGVGVFQWCSRARSPMGGRAARWTRERGPGANAPANRLRANA